MNNLNLKAIVENLIDTFIHAGKISLDLRKQGLIKKIKADNTPVSNGDLEVNKIVTKKIWSSMIRAFIDYEFRNFKKK